MKSYNMHKNSSKQSKRKQLTKDRIPPQICNAYNTNENYENVKRISKNNYQIVDSNIRLKTNYPKDFNPIFFSTKNAKLPEEKLNKEILTLVPYSETKCYRYNKIVKENSTLLAKLTIHALAASERDVSAILELVEKMYNSIQELLQDVKQKQEMFKHSVSIAKKCANKPNYVIKIDLKKFIKYLNEQYIRNTDNIPRKVKNQVVAPYCKQPSIVYPTKRCKSFNILFQPRRLSFNLTVCKYSSCSMGFFQRLATFYELCNPYNASKKKPVPSVFIRDWHFKNVSQGYLLSVLLKQNNIMTLNIMRKLYFVIITSVTSNLTIEINFKLAHGLFDTYEMSPFKKMPIQGINWSDRHRNILECSSRILYTPPTFAYYNQNSNHNLITDLQETISEDTLLNNMSFSDCSSTLKYDSSNEGSDYFVRSTSYSETGFIDLKPAESNMNITFKESGKTLTLSIDEMLSYHALLGNRKDCGDINLTTMLQQQYNNYNSSIQRSRTWMTKLKTEVIVPYLNSLMNETVFDRLTVSIENCVGVFTQLLDQFESKTLYRKFLVDLGGYVIHTILISLVYILTE